ncbi:MAG: sugar phosphate isomerase/epimerase, partial [bacterium]|nr:sugar phosphate isomerase/epimerase [bacterium]
MKTGVCSYCFNALINAGELTLFDAIEFVGEQTEAECFEPLSRYWDPQQDEIEQAREARSIADKTGLTFSCHALDSDFAVYDQAANRAAIDLCIRRLETTRILGANTVRLDPRTSLPKDSEEPDVDDILERIAHSMAEIADAAATMDIRVGVENHGRLLGRTSQTAHLVELVNRKNFGVNIDFTNFKVVFGEDHIEATRKLAKHVVHAHAKDFL